MYTSLFCVIGMIDESIEILNYTLIIKLDTILNQLKNEEEYRYPEILQLSKVVFPFLFPSFILLFFERLLQLQWKSFGALRNSCILNFIDKSINWLFPMAFFLVLLRRS